MSPEWYDLQNEYNELLLKPNPTTADERRILEIEQCCWDRWGSKPGRPESFDNEADNT